MPEGLEAEIWRRALEVLIGTTVTDVWADARVADREVVAVLPGSSIERIDRRGKVVIVVTDGPSVGLHFGMTGRVEVHGEAPITELEYSSRRDLSSWDRLRIWVDGADRSSVPALRMNDPRRLGRISLDPDLSHLGVDMTLVDRTRLREITSRRRAAIKTLLLDQSAIAGVGNLCADEVLWWAGIAPHRPSNELTADEIASLVTAIRRRLPIMLRRGGSTMGTLTPDVRAHAGPCPRDGALLERSTIGGRTAVWCPAHQR